MKWPEPARFSEEVRQQSVDLTNKVGLTQQKTILKKKSMVILIALVSPFHVKQSDFKDINMFSSLTRKCMKV